MNVVQTGFGENVSFEMRTFLFITTGSSALEAPEAQDQTVSCNLHSEPANDITTTQPDNCSCYTEADCSTPGHDQFNLFGAYPDQIMVHRVVDYGRLYLINILIRDFNFRSMLIVE